MFPHVSQSLHEVEPHTETAAAAQDVWMIMCPMPTRSEHNGSYQASTEGHSNACFLLLPFLDRATERVA